MTMDNQRGPGVGRAEFDSVAITAMASVALVEDLLVIIQDQTPDAVEALLRRTRQIVQADRLGTLPLDERTRPVWARQLRILERALQRGGAQPPAE